MDLVQAMKPRPRDHRRQGTEARVGALQQRKAPKIPLPRSTKVAPVDAPEATADDVTNLIPPSEITMKQMMMTTQKPQPPPEVTPKTQIATKTTATLIKSRNKRRG